MPTSSAARAAGAPARRLRAARRRAGRGDRADDVDERGHRARGRRPRDSATATRSSTSDPEHPGLLGPLLAARRRGMTMREVPFAPRRGGGAGHGLVARSHVSWVGGEVVPAALQDLDVPVLLDGAQGAGAIHVDPRGLGCVAYAARARSGCAARTAPGSSGSTPRSRSGSSWSARATCRSPTSPPVSRAASAHDRALRHALAPARGGRPVARRDRAAGAPRLGRGPGARRRARAAARRRAGRARPDGHAARRDHARELGGPGRRGGPDRLAGPGSSCATSPAARCCAPRSARGTTSPTWTGCSTASPRRAPAPGPGRTRAP